MSSGKWRASCLGRNVFSKDVVYILQAQVDLSRGKEAYIVWIFQWYQNTTI